MRNLKTTKLFMASSAFVRECHPSHRSGNGNCQFTVLVRAKTAAQAAAVIGAPLSALRRFGFSIRKPEDRLGKVFRPDAPTLGEVAAKEGVVYYGTQLCEWFEAPADPSKPPVPVPYPTAPNQRSQREREEPGKTVPTEAEAVLRARVVELRGILRQLLRGVDNQAVYPVIIRRAAHEARQAGVESPEKWEES